MRILRVLATLVKRQMTDDAPLLIGAFAGALAFLLVLGLLAFVYPHSFLLHVATILIALPFLSGMGFFALGAVQVCGDEQRGIPGTLSVLSVTSGQIILARVATGMVFVLIITGGLALAIAGAVLSGLVQWPESLVPEGLVDLFVALLLMGLACYCLGILAGRGPATWVALFRLLPLVLVFASLTVIKGFGWPLAILVVPFIAAFLVCLLASARYRCPAVLSLGLVVALVTAVPLYWLRYGSDVITALVMLEISDEDTLTLYRDFRLARDLYSQEFLAVRSGIRSGDFPVDYGDVHFLLRPIGILSYLRAKEPDGHSIDLDHFGSRWGLHDDKSRGFLVDADARGTLYIGPEGIADKPTEALGHFSSPIVYRARRRDPLVFDRQTRGFYTVDLDEQDVCPRLRLDDAVFQPVDPIRSRLGDGICFVGCSYPSSRDRPDVPYAGDDTSNYLPVVDESGTVAVIDLRTWKLLSDAGHLPRPHTFFGRGSSRPRDLFDYGVGVIVKRPENEEYAGLMAASVSRQGSLVTVAVFDKEGRLVQESYGRCGFRPVLFLTTKYLVESLHPPVLTLASFFTAYSFEAGATYRAMFLMPNSFVALQRDRETNFIFQLLAALLFLLPALAFSGFLSWRVVRDAAVMGSSRWARRLWGLATFALGLPVYITYRLTRPRIALALCSNCGRGRRVDRDVCHHCGGGWDVPALESPAWRVTSRL
jgi:hypothetical protein